MKQRNSLLLVFLLTACGGGEDKSAPSGEAPAPTVGQETKSDQAGQDQRRLWAAASGIARCLGAEHGLPKARTADEAERCLRAAFLQAWSESPPPTGRVLRSRAGFMSWHQLDTKRVCNFQETPQQAPPGAPVAECDTQVGALVKAAAEGKDPLLIAADYLKEVKVPRFEADRAELEKALREESARPAPSPEPETTQGGGQGAAKPGAAGRDSMAPGKEAPIPVPMIEEDPSLRMMEKLNPGSGEAERQKRLQRATVVAVMHAKRPEVVSCYKKARAKDNYLQGRLTVVFTVTAPGRATACSVSKPLRDPSVGQCACARLLTWKFPYPEGPDFQHTWTWTLTIGD